MYLPTMGWSALSGLLLWQVGLMAVRLAREHWARLAASAPIRSPAASGG